MDVWGEHYESLVQERPSCHRHGQPPDQKVGVGVTFMWCGFLVVVFFLFCTGRYSFTLLLR